MNTMSDFQAEQVNVQYKEMKWTKTHTIVVVIVLLKTLLGAISLQFY